MHRNKFADSPLARLAGWFTQLSAFLIQIVHDEHEFSMFRPHNACLGNVTCTWQDKANELLVLILQTFTFGEVVLPSRGELSAAIVAQCEEFPCSLCESRGRLRFTCWATALV